ncbi:MAG: TonB-dependent receptor [Bacteroidia bacterium]|nr:TonB-dependent receptor [Bacteroidia bacterium]
MKKIILSTLLGLMGTALLAQNMLIQGKLNDSKGAPVAFASVLLMDQADSSLVKGAYSDQNGKFYLRINKEGDYFMEVNAIGFEKYVINPIPDFKGKLDLETVRLKNQDQQLQEVKISAIKPIIEIKSDKTVFNVQSSLAASGTSGFELLRKAPGVIIDNNNNLIVEGKSGVQIFIDGKQTLLSGDDLLAYLQSLQASNIEAIEIITQPSSRYDAAGTAGIINIKLKRDLRFGINGSLNSTISYGRNFRNNHSISLNQRNRKFATYLNYSNKFGQAWDFMNLYREQAGINFYSESENIRGGNTHNFKAGTDIFIGERGTLGLIVGGDMNDKWIEGRTETPIIPFGDAVPTQVLIANNRTNSQSRNFFSNINYRYEDTLGRKWSIDLDQGNYNRDRSNYQPNSYFDGSTNDLLFERNFQMYTPNEVSILSAKTDFEFKLGKGSLATGVKVSQVSTDNTFDFYDVVFGEELFNAGRSNNFSYTEQINAGYVNLSQKFSKVDFQLGLRLEQTLSEGILLSTQQSANQQVNRSYVNFFPSGGVTYKAGWKNQFALNYSRRINRPNYQSLNPFEYQVDELSFSKGNPFLQPQYSDNIRLAYTYRYAATAAISYSYTHDFFAQITDVVDERRNVMQVQNIADKEVINLNLSIPYDIKNWWSVYVSLNAFHASYSSENVKFDPIERATLSFYAQNTFSLPKGIKFEVSGWFSSPSVWGGTYRTKSLGSLDLGLQKKFLDERLTARLSMGDVLFTSPWRGVTQFGDLRITGTGGWESRTVRFSLAYDFGNRKLKAAKKRKLGSNEESSRVK